MKKISWMNLRKVVFSAVILVIPLSYFIGGKFAAIAFPIASWGGLYLMAAKAVAIMKNEYKEEPHFTSVLGGETLQTSGMFLSITGFCLGFIISLKGDIKFSSNFNDYWPIMTPAIEGMLATAWAMYLASSVNNIGKLKYPKPMVSGSTVKLDVEIDTADLNKQIYEISEKFSNLTPILNELISNSKKGNEFFRQFQQLFDQVAVILESCAKFFPGRTS